MSSTNKLRVFIPLKNGIGKKVSAVRQELSGDWKGIPPHMTILEIGLGDCVMQHSIELTQIVQSIVSEYIVNATFALCDQPNDVRQFTIFTALRYNANKNLKELYDKITNAIVKCANISGEITRTETTSVVFSIGTQTIYTLPLYASDLTQMKTHVSIIVTEKIIKDDAHNIIRTRLGKIMQTLTSEHFSDAKIEIINRP
jgi:hypothetical protein